MISMPQSYMRHSSALRRAASVLVLLGLVGMARAQQPISSTTDSGGVEVTDTVAANASEIIGNVTVDSVDYYDIEIVAAQAVLQGPSSGQGPVDEENYCATSTVTVSTLVGRTYTFQGWAGACYYYGYGDDDDDDDDDDNGGLAVGATRSTATGTPQFSEPYPCSGGWLGYLPLSFQTGAPSIISISPRACHQTSQMRTDAK